MPVAVSKLSTRTDFLATESPRVVVHRAAPARTKPAETPLLLRILTASVSAHLLLVGFLGAGLPKPTMRPKRPAAPPPTKADLIENVKLQEEPPPEPPKTVDRKNVLPTPDLPVAADIDLPPLSKIEPIAAVPASVPVAFGLEVKGRVRLVAGVSQASGSVGGRALTEPVAIDGDSAREKNLVLAPLAYPAEGLLHHQQGTVLLEFHTSVTGGIADVKVRTSSGFAALDRAAEENLAEGRWLGAAGNYLKEYEFKLN